MNGKILEILESRKATRSISPEPLPDEMIDYLLDAARLAPSCFNKQPWRFLVLRSEEARARGREALSEGNRPWAGRAPLLLVGYSRAGEDCQLGDGREYHQFDLGLALMNIMLAATELDLVARPMAGFDPGRIRSEFALDRDEQPLVMLAVGKPSADTDHLPDYARELADKPRERKPLREIARIL